MYILNNLNFNMNHLKRNHQTQMFPMVNSDSYLGTTIAAFLYFLQEAETEE